MLFATRALVDAVRGSARGSWPLDDARARAIARLGTVEDAAALLEAFLEAPERRSELVEPLMFAGDAHQARRLLEACCDARGLRHDAPAEVLHCAGYHGLEDAEPLLWRYARGDDLPADNAWEAQTAAARGLLHLPCDRLRGEIDAAIRGCVGEALFPEHLPSLAAKVGDPDLADVLWRIGEAASTDCLGGVILGLALLGDAGRPRFEALMWDPHREAADTGTGNVGALFAGTCALRLPLGDVYDAWKRREGGDRVHGVFVVKNLLDARLRTWHTGLRFAPGPPDDAAAVHARLFAWTTPHRDDGFPALARQALEGAGHPFADEIVRDLEALERQLELRIGEELLLAELTEPPQG